MYQVLCSVVTDSGVEPDVRLRAACADLANQVNAIESDGWEPVGGVEVYSRQKQGVTMIWVMQGMKKSSLTRQEAQELINSIPPVGSPAGVILQVRKPK